MVMIMLRAKSEARDKAARIMSPSPKPAGGAGLSYHFIPRSVYIATYQKCNENGESELIMLRYRN